MAYGYDTRGNKRGAILSRRYVTTYNGLDYYEAEVPESAPYLSTFALVKLSGSGNPFQIITLTIASHIGSGGGAGGRKWYAGCCPEHRSPGDKTTNAS